MKKHIISTTNQGILEAKNVVQKRVARYNRGPRDEAVAFTVSPRCTFVNNGRNYVSICALTCTFFLISTTHNQNNDDTYRTIAKKSNELTISSAHISVLVHCFIAELLILR